MAQAHRKILPPDLSHISLPIIYSDKAIAVIDKPPGMLAVPGTTPGTEDSVLGRVRQAFPEARGPIIAHRLDMATSGVMITGLTPYAHSWLSTQFQNRQAQKTYEAIVEGEVLENHGVITLAFRKDFQNKPSQILDAVNGKLGTTHWTVLERKAGRTRLVFRPVTGRTHQLRLHAAHDLGLGIPIVGDRLYGGNGAEPRLLLHSRSLTIQHPLSEESLTFEIPTPF